MNKTIRNIELVALMMAMTITNAFGETKIQKTNGCERYRTQIEQIEKNNKTKLTKKESKDRRALLNYGKNTNYGAWPSRINLIPDITFTTDEEIKFVIKLDEIFQEELQKCKLEKERIEVCLGKDPMSQKPGDRYYISDYTRQSFNNGLALGIYKSFVIKQPENKKLRPLKEIQQSITEIGTIYLGRYGVAIGGEKRKQIYGLAKITGNRKYFNTRNFNYSRIEG